MKHLNKLLFLAILFLSFESYSQCTVAVTTTNVLCNVMCDGTAQATATGTSPFTYSINNGASINPTTGFASNLCAGVYTITATDGVGCIATTSVVISQPVPITLNTISDSTICNGSCTGSINSSTTGGIGFIIYSIFPNISSSNTTGTFNNLCAGIYTISATDANGCVVNNTAIVNQPLPFNFDSINTVSTSCNANGSACVFTSGGNPPYQYSLNNCATYQLSNCFNGLLTGTYTICAKDANACTSTSIATIWNTNPNQFSIVSTTPASCSPGCDGTVTLSSNAPMIYSIAPLSGSIIISGNTITGLCAGTNYSITGTDQTGCSTTYQIFIQTPIPTPISIASSTPPSCVPGCDGTVTMLPSVSFTYSIVPTVINPIVGNVISGLCANTLYTIVGTDVYGCTTTSTINLSTISFTPTITTGPGSISASAPSQTSPILYSLNGAPFSSINSFNGLCTGSYTLQVQDGNGCVAINYPYVTSDTAFPGVIMNTIITDANCQNSLDGSVDFIFVPASTHYFCPFGWSNCGITTSYHDQLAPATYGLDIIDSATNYCVTKMWTINSSGINCGDIDGTVYLDSNSNCINDANDMPLNNIPIQLSSGQFTFTNPAGNYSFNGLAYNNYTVSQPNSSWWNNFLTNSCGNNFNVTLNSTTPNIVQNFADTSIAILNNSILVSSAFYVPGITTSINVIHYGTSPAISSNGIITLVLDPNLVYQNANPTPNYVSTSGDTLKWNYSNFTTYDSYQVNVTTNTTATLSMPIANCVYDDVTSGVDAYLPDNTSCTNGIVWSSWDPNNKVVSPAGTQPNGGILKQDSVLSYTINFQNTGTYLAHKVVVMDTLSDKVDLSKFRVIHYSHPYEIEVIDNHILKFIFNQIMLPDSNSNEPASHGHISYQILQKNTNQLGDVIKNKASIYFDYNAPIVTNETVNTIVAPTGIINTVKNNSVFNVYPNPAQNEIVINSNSIIDAISILDIQSRVVLSKNSINKNVVNLNIQSLKNGIYFIKTSNGMVQRFVVNK